jgi:hypothetical protein
MARVMVRRSDLTGASPRQSAHREANINPALGHGDGVTGRAQDSKSAQGKRRELADVFGDVLPETTSDERSEASDGARETERWYRENRPPHHERD